jgi:putative zinc finger/helix-turn-helix YgiT family protein
MVKEHTHQFEQFHATISQPYHFVDSGLPNVYLVGIKYRKCDSCGTQSAEIPAIEELMKVIARAVTRKDDLLTGLEIRFLRKRLGKKSSDFANLVGVVPEEVSRWENHPDKGHHKSTDRLIRLLYCFLSGDPGLEKQFNQHIAEWLSSVPGEEHMKKYCAKLRNKEWTAEPVTTCASS